MLKMNHQRGYRKFVNERDAALETILRNTRLKMSEDTASAFRNILQQIHLKYNKIMHTSSRHEMDQLEGQIQMILEHLTWNLWMQLIELRKKAYMLAYAGEAQAIAQTIAKTPKINLSKSVTEKLMSKPLANGLQPMKAWQLYTNKIRRQIISNLEYSLAFGEPMDKALGRAWTVLPKTRILPQKKVLKTVKLEEAKEPSFSQYDEDSAVEISVGPRGGHKQLGFTWDQETWDQVVSDLDSDYKFTNRSPENFVDITNPWNDLPVKDSIPEDDKVYGWEVENEVVHDFVEQVRSGQIEAAQQNGIDDFVWIAILDDRTDACCEWRSGLLTSEIEARLKSDKSGDDCQATVPPAHFNCRCTLAPASSDLEAVDNKDIEMEFDEWLNKR